MNVRQPTDEREWAPWRKAAGQKRVAMHREQAYQRCAACLGHLLVPSRLLGEMAWQHRAHMSLWLVDGTMHLMIDSSCLIASGVYHSLWQELLLQRSHGRADASNHRSTSLAALQWPQVQWTSGVLTSWPVSLCSKAAWLYLYVEVYLDRSQQETTLTEAGGLRERQGWVRADSRCCHGGIGKWAATLLHKDGAVDSFSVVFRKARRF